MIRLRLFCLLLTLYFPVHIFPDEIPIHYQLIDRDSFQDIVVGNTIVGVTLQSHSLYMLHFLPDGYCELWKQNKIYAGSW